MTRQFDPCGSDPPPRLNLEDAPDFLEQLLQSAPCEDATAELLRLGLLIDLGDDLDNADAPRNAIDGLDRLVSSKGLDPRARSLAHYFLSNAWDVVRRIESRDPRQLAWEQPELEYQIINLRKAVREAQAAEIETIRVCQMLTNLGNLFSHVGRVVEAVEAWDAALRRDADFSMALGNRGSGLFHDASRSHDPGHQVCLLRESYTSLEKAVGVVDDQRVKDGFESLRAQIRELLSEETLSKPQPTRGASDEWEREEEDYRKWCVRNRLFLNDLNDINLGWVCAADVLNLPSLTTSIDAPQPSALGFMNQLKQEFVSARFVLYDGTSGRDVHYSDRDVKLVNTLDYPAYGLAVEQVKYAFRIAYSLFDKVAYFLNDYFGLGVPERQVSFRSLWYVKGQPKKGLRAEFDDSTNRGLMALFWVAKDLYDSRPQFAEAIEPEAQELAAIRNHLEHKYLKVHQSIVPSAEEPAGVGYEALAFSLTRRDLESKTLRVLQLARAALIYLVHAV